MARVRTQVSIDSDLLNEVDTYCEKMYMTRSGLISYALVQIINQDKVANALTGLKDTLEQISRNGVMDDKSRQDLADLSALCRMMSGK